MNYLTAKEALKNISTLKPNWNYNDAPAFSKELINKCEEILDNLPFEPFVCPTAIGSVQFEYEDKNEDKYLEFDIYEDKAEVFKIDNGKQKEFTIEGDIINQMVGLVNEFYDKKAR